MRGGRGHTAPRALLLAASLGAFLGVVGVALPSDIRTIDAPGVWTLTRLGFDGQTTLGAGGAESMDKTFRFRLPEGARQGGSTWYLLRYHFRLAIAPETGSGRIYVGAATNGRATAQIRFDIQRLGSRISIVSHELGYVGGSRQRAGAGLVRELRFANFLQYKGVKPGINTLSFYVQQYANARVKSLTVFPDSGLELSTLGPSEVTMALAVPQREIEVDEAFELVVDLKNRRGRAPGTVTVQLALPAGMTARSGASATLRWPEGKRAVRATFRLSSAREGRRSVGVFATTPVTHPGTSIAVGILPASGPGRARWVGALLAAAAVVAGVVVAARWRATPHRP